MNLGLLGELQVELQLVALGWHPVRLNARQEAANTDLLAIKQLQRISIQVKTTGAEAQHSHSDCLQFGYATVYLRDKRSIFNSKANPLTADGIVGVYLRATAPRFVVLPAAFAESLRRRHADYRKPVPKMDGEKRSDAFPIYLSFTGKRKRRAHGPHHEQMKWNLWAFDDNGTCRKNPLNGFTTPWHGHCAIEAKTPRDLESLAKHPGI